MSLKKRIPTADMGRDERHYSTELAVVGSGLAGFAASVFALARGITCAQVGNTGAVAYTTGYFDLLGYCQDQWLDDPWRGLELLRESEPHHPLSRIDRKEIRAAFDQFTVALTEMGVGYTVPADRNNFALTPAGTVKPTLSVPETMLSGIEARKVNARTLVIDILGLQGFSAKEFVANMRSSWPQLSAAKLSFPDMESGGQVFPEVMARALEVSSNRERFAERVKAVLGDAQRVGMPAIMGIHHPDRVHAELQRLVGVPLFEIPTMPPAVPGIRLREMFEQAFPARGLTLVPQQKVKHLELEAGRVMLYLRDSFGEMVIESKTAILATGRFLSGGLKAERVGVREALMGIPVIQPGSRADWYRQDYFDPLGHPVNRSGVEVDSSFRPLGPNGEPVSDRLFAAGILLAHQDWVRQRCGAGVAIASAYKTVEAAARLLQEQ